MGCVEFEPVSGTFVGYTPLPDATTWKFEVPGGITIGPDGKVGLLRVTICPRENRLAVDHALRPGEPIAGMAATLRLDSSLFRVECQRVQQGFDRLGG